MFWLRSCFTALFILLAASAFADVQPIVAYSAKDASTVNATLTIPNVNCGAGNLCKFNLVWRQTAGQTASTPTYGGATTDINLISPTIPGGGATTGCVNGRCVKTWWACGLTGTQSVVFTLSAAGNTFASVLVYAGADCSGTPVGTSVQSDSMASGVGTSVATTISSAAGQMGSDVLMLSDKDGVNTVPVAGQTQRALQGDSGSVAMLASDEPTSTSMGWDFTAEGETLHFIHIATPILAAGTVPDSATEAFTGTGNLSANWTHQTDYNRIGRFLDRGWGSSNPDVNCAFYSGVTWNANHSSQVKIVENLSTPGGDYGGVSVNNSTDTGNAAFDNYTLFTDGTGGSDHFVLDRRVNEVGTRLANYSETVAVNDTIKLERSGSTLKAYVNGAEVFCDSGAACSAGVVTDTTLTGGSPGICIIDDTGVDDWVGTSLASGVWGLMTFGVGR